MTTLSLHTIDGSRIGDYQLNFNGAGTALTLDLVSANVWFGGKLLREGDWNVVQDSLGSVRWRQLAVSPYTIEKADYYPFGQEKPSTTAQGREKFGTYLRDETGLDYADQRYFSSTVGRFMTADPYKASGGPGGPGSWNRYSYVEGDPVNSYDPNGLFQCVRGVTCAEPPPPPPPSVPDPLPPPLGPMGGGGDIAECVATYKALYGPDADASYCYGPQPPPPSPEECQKGVVTTVINTVAANLGLSLGNFTITSVTVAGFGGSQTEVNFTYSSPDGVTLQQFLNASSNFTSNANDALVGAPHCVDSPNTRHCLRYDGNFRSNSATNSLQINVTGNVGQMDIDPYNPAYGLFGLLGHGILQVLPNTIWSRDTNYASVASQLNIPVPTCP